VLKRIFGTKKEEVGGDWRRKHNEEFHNPYTSPEGKGLLGRYTYRKDDNIKMDLREIQWEVMDWIHLTQDRDQWQVLLNTVMNLGVP